MMKALIIDDEKKARDGIISLGKGYTELEIIGEAKDGAEAISSINQLHPDLIFLDIQMPGINGLDVLNSIDKSISPIVIFCTAYDQYAIQAFELQAIDYLLKPFSKERFYKAVNHAFELYNSTKKNHITQKIEQLLTKYQGETDESSIINSSDKSKQLLIKSKGKVHFIHLDDIEWIESLDSYIKIHLRDKVFIVKGSLKNLENRYGNLLTRIHKSRLVNLSKVDFMESDFNGDFFLTLKSNLQIRGSRNYKQNLPQLL